MRIAVLGMGRMGRAAALRLLELGHAVRVWNRTPGRADEVVTAGAVEAVDLAAVAEHADVLLLSLSEDTAVNAVVEELVSVPGWAAEMPPILVDTSTVAPATSQGVQGRVPDHRMVAAPIAGAPEAVRSGRAVGLVGGRGDLVAALEPVWSALFTSYRYCGEGAGDATTFKVINNYLLIAGIATLAEAVALGQHAGVDSQALREFLQGPVVAPALHNRLEDILGGDHQGWFTTMLGAKDVRLATDLAQRQGLELSVAGSVAQCFEYTAAHGWGEADLGAVIEPLREAASRHNPEPPSSQA